MSSKASLGMIFLFLVLIVGGSVISGSFYTIDQGERGVILRYGKVVDIAEPGLGFKIPFIEDVKIVSTQIHAVTYKGLQAYSQDQQPATMNVSVNYHVTDGDAAALYTQFGTVENLEARIIDKQVPTQMENVFGQYTAISAVQDRNKLVADLTAAIKNNVVGPVIIDSVQIENIDFSAAYEQSVETRMQAQIAIETRQQEYKTSQINAQIQVTNAQGQADSQLAKAKANAEATRIQGDADAAAILAKSKALQTNPSLVALTAAEKWNGQLPTTMIPGSTVPFITVGNDK